jgi:hypothetical protein
MNGARREDIDQVIALLEQAKPNLKALAEGE